MTESQSRSSPYVLVVEDNEADLFLIQEALATARLAVQVRIIKDGEQAVRFFDRADQDSGLACPELVILDINLPKKQGGEVLRHMRQSSKCAAAPVVAISTSDSAQDRLEMTNLGAKRYFRKPSDYEDFMKLGEIVKRLIDENEQ